MGLLDDAIREHLDLKRRRGADPSEIAREEADALGPARREAEQPPIAAQDPAPLHGSYADEEPLAYEDEPVAYEDDPPTVSEPSTPRERPYAEREDESAAPPHGDPLAHQHTREFSATELGDALGHEEDEPPTPADPAPPEDEDEDVLEETPDFLQETPEHDRLWFEQKPPKDFDF
ncbi:MAG TPA: hypothetical protein VI318_25805 [Baekduia sp.]